LQQPEIAFDTETTNIDAMLAEMIGMSFSWKQGEGYYVFVPENREEATALLERFRQVFERADVLWIGQNLKYDMTMLKHYGFMLKGKLYDTMLANYVIEPEGKRSMDILSAKYLRYKPVSIETLIGKGKNQKSMRGGAREIVTEYAAEDGDVAWRLKQCFEPMVKHADV